MVSEIAVAKKSVSIKTNFMNNNECNYSLAASWTVKILQIHASVSLYRSCQNWAVSVLMTPWIISLSFGHSSISSWFDMR